MRPRAWAALFGKLVEDLFGLWKAAALLLGKQELSVDEHVELTLAAYLQDGDRASFLFDIGRETRSPGFVVSHQAVLDDDLHGQPPC